MMNTRTAWTVGSVLTVAIAVFPGAAARADQPFRVGDLNQAAANVLEPPQEPQVTPETFGTSYIYVVGTDFTNFYLGEWNSVGDAGRYSVSGTAVYAVQPDIPNGVTVTEIEFYVVDNAAAPVDALLHIYFATAGSRGLMTSVFGSTSGQSTAVQTVPVSFTPYVADSGSKRLILAVDTTVNDSRVEIMGARVGYTGAPGQLIMFPAPDRFVDTRPATPLGGKNTKYEHGEAFDHTVTGVAGRDGNIIPAGAKAVLGNVVAVDPTQKGNFKLLPGGTSTTVGTASVNFTAGINIGNAFTVRLNAAGQIRGFHTSPGGTTDLVIDIVGYYR